MRITRTSISAFVVLSLALPACSSGVPPESMSSETAVVDTESPLRSAAKVTTTVQPELGTEQVNGQPFVMDGPYEAPALPSDQTTHSKADLQANPTFLSGFSVPTSMVLQYELNCDPQGATSSTHVVVLCTRQLGFFTRAGTLLSQQTFANFFSPIGGSTPGIFYNDTRALWDQYRQRFWVTAQGQASGARARLFIAVSKTSNPTQGWWLYARDAIGSDCSTCNPPRLPTDGIDYQQIGISRDRFWFNNRAGNYFVAQHFDANAAANGQGPSGWIWWDLTNPDGNPVSRMIPTKHHDQTDAQAFMVDRYLSNHIELWTAANATTNPGALTRTDITLPNTFVDNVNGRQPGTTQLLDFTRLAGDILSSSAYRNDRLVFVASQRYRWPGTAADSSLIRLVMLRPSDKAVITDLLFGSPDIDYGYPSVDVNVNNVFGITFTRTSSSIKPEMRFMTLASDGTHSGSTLLTGSSGVLTSAAQRQFDLQVWSDLSEVSADPSNDGSFWAFHQNVPVQDKFGMYVAHVNP